MTARMAAKSGWPPCQTVAVAEVEDFLAEVLPRLHAAEVALHSGDPRPRGEMWSQVDPVTLFGAEVDHSGWTNIGPVFDWLSTRFTACEALEYDVIAAGASGDLGYLVAYEHFTATVSGEPTSYSLRATTVFRREAGQWRVAHRHGDALRV
jgi:ketosteroid isomerase-like protein